MAPSFTERHDDLAALNGTTKSSHLPASTNTDPPEPTFRYTSTKRLRNAQHAVAHDFRSDVVTVPTESMMQVCSLGLCQQPPAVELTTVRRRQS